MTISSSLNAGVAGLRANANKLATISDNIANSATLGYKRSVTDFHSIVVGEDSPGRYTAGGVRTTTLRLVDERGPVVGTDNSTDLVLDGRGFLPVTPQASLTAADQVQTLSLMTTGSFRADAEGYLVNPTGQVLLGWPAQLDGSVALQPRETISGLQPVRIAMNQLSANPTTTAAISLNLPATATRAGETGAPYEMSMEYFTNLGVAETLRFSFTPDVPGTGASNSWTLDITDSASGGSVGSYRLEFSTAATSGGLLSTVTTLSGGAYDPATGAMTLALPNGPIDLSIGRPGETGGLSQLSSSFIPSAPVKNGSPVAGLVGIEVDAKGNLHGVYDQGFTRLLYQIPVVDVPNPNGLTPIGSQAYQVSMRSGAFYLWDAGDGPTGSMLGFAREESTTDVAHELTQLIQTQRAYSSNAKVIQTVDEMLQETTNLKR